MMHADDMALDGGELQHDVDEQQPPLVIDLATLGQSEFDLPVASAGASWHQQVPSLVLNLDTLGQSEIVTVMPGDETNMDIEVVTESAAAVQVAGS